jgi:hypothetical protein
MQMDEFHKYSGIVPSMQLTRLTVVRSNFRRLSESKQLFLVRFGQVHNDLRYIRQMVVTAHNGFTRYTGVEREIALHQFWFGIKLWCGALTEAEHVIRTDWYGSGLSAHMHNELEPDAVLALKRFQRDFAKKSLVRQVRDKFAFHYDRESIAATLRKRVRGDYTIVTGRRRANIFYNFAESVRKVSLVRTVGRLDPRTSASPLFRDLKRLHDWFMTFSHAILNGIIQQCGVREKTITSRAVNDPTRTLPTIFVDERAIIRELRKHGFRHEDFDR